MPGCPRTLLNAAPDATRDVREKAGQVWVFDPQGIALEEPTWWWNPLSYVTDEVKAARNIRIVPTAPMFAQAILNIWNGTSVSSLFETDTLGPIYEGLYTAGGA